MKFLCSLVLIVFCGLSCYAQKANEKAEIAARQKILKKQIIADDFDRQAQDVSVAAVRVFVRMRLAEWLWRDGGDETGRAELLAVKAVEELYGKKDEIPESLSLKSRLFSLLDVNAGETAKKLRAKYNVESAEDLSNAFPLLNREGGDKIVAAKLKNNLPGQTDLGQTAIYLRLMQSKKSPEYLPVLSEIINLQESGKINYPPLSLNWIADIIRDSTVPNDLKNRFYRIILSKARSALQSSDAAEIQYTDSLLYAVLRNISTNAPELTGEANALKTALSAKTSQRARERQESEQKIEESADKLAALIAEADKTEDSGAKYNLLNRASLLAMKEGKFRLAVDLLEKTIENVPDKRPPGKEFRRSYYDQQLNQIREQALIKDDVDAASYAVKRIGNDLKKADALYQTASYFIRKKDLPAALGVYEEALKLAAKSDDAEHLKIYTLVRLINAAAVIEPGRVSEVTSLTAKTLDRMPTPNPEDKPGTEKFTDYVSAVMRVNYSLYPAVAGLARINKPEAVVFAGLINRKEFKIIAELALAIDSFEFERKKTESP